MEEFDIHELIASPDTNAKQKADLIYAYYHSGTGRGATAGIESDPETLHRRNVKKYLAKKSGVVAHNELLARHQVLGVLEQGTVEECDPLLVEGDSALESEPDPSALSPLLDEGASPGK